MVSSSGSVSRRRRQRGLMFREWLGSVRLSSLGDIGPSSSGVLGVRVVVEDRKKTGSRRRNVIKEDLVAEEQKTSGEFTHKQPVTHTTSISEQALCKFFKQMSILKQLQLPAAGELLFRARHA